MAKLLALFVGDVVREVSAQAVGRSTPGEYAIFLFNHAVFYKK
jgi:hypothetical protein